MNPTVSVLLGIYRYDSRLPSSCLGFAIPRSVVSNECPSVETVRISPRRSRPATERPRSAAPSFPSFGRLLAAACVRPVPVCSETSPADSDGDKRAHNSRLFHLHKVSGVHTAADIDRKEGTQ